MRAGRRLFSKAFFTTKTTSNIFNFFSTRFTCLVEFNSEIKKIRNFACPLPLIHATFQSNCAEGLHFSAFSLYMKYHCNLQDIYMYRQETDGLGLKLACLMIHGLGKTDSGYNN